MLTVFAAVMFFGTFICFSLCVGVFITNLIRNPDDPKDIDVDHRTIIYCLILALIGAYCFAIGVDMIITDVTVYRAYG